MSKSLLYACPFGAISAIAIILNGYIGDATGRKIAVSVIPLFVSIIGVSLIVGLPQSAKGGRLAGFYISPVATATYVTLLSFVGTNVAGYTKKTTVAALFLICYCTGNIIGMSVAFQSCENR